MSKRLCEIAGLIVTSFSGGKEKGKCLQFDLPPAFVVLDKQDVEELQANLEGWLTTWQLKREITP